MRSPRFASLCLATLAGAALAEHIPPQNVLWGPKGAAGAGLVKRASSTMSAPAASTSRVADSSCLNTAFTRNCWGNGFSIATDFDAKWPNTGVTRSYILNIQNGTCNPDGGIPNGGKVCLSADGMIPGPTLIGNWGDMFSVTVNNHMQHNATSIHFHGVRQLNSVHMDGTCGITECPVPPGASKTYTWQATQFGTSWWHSHYSAQYGDGVFGGIQINGPASANYDVDLGTYALTDWYYQTATQVSIQTDRGLQNGGPGPSPDSMLINGTNKAANGAGSYNTVTMTAGKKYRLRLINTSVDNAIRVQLDGHQFQVIAGDFVPIKPFYTNWLLVNIGQRYDVIIFANQSAGNYWFRANAEGGCTSGNANNALSIFNYAGVKAANPTTSPTVPQPHDCNEAGPLVPFVTNIVPNSTFYSQVNSFDVDVNRQQVTTNGQNLLFWGVNISGINVDWADPTLEYVYSRNTSYPSVLNLVEIPNENTWTYWIIQETTTIPVPIPHPIHLHGHDFYILGTGTGLFNMQTDPPNLAWVNPMRRDTTNLPANGWLAIAFPADNPGAWLMHCHIAWHIDEGLGVQFLESKNTISQPDDGWKRTCSEYKSWYGQNPVYLKADSGL